MNRSKTYLNRAGCSLYRKPLVTASSKLPRAQVMIWADKSASLSPDQSNRLEQVVLSWDRHFSCPGRSANLTKKSKGSNSLTNSLINCLLSSFKTYKKFLSDKRRNVLKINTKCLWSQLWPDRASVICRKSRYKASVHSTTYQSWSTPPCYQVKKLLPTQSLFSSLHNYSSKDTNGSKMQSKVSTNQSRLWKIWSWCRGTHQRKEF